MYRGWECDVGILVLLFGECTEGSLRAVYRFGVQLGTPQLEILAFWEISKKVEVPLWGYAVHLEFLKMRLLSGCL